MPTPMMEQYRRVKADHPDALLFFRLGDFYELFYDDAKTASRLLGITLTARDKEGERIPMAGVPHHAAANYIRKLLAFGRKIAICDQVEDAAAAQGIVKRGVTQVVTPGTVTEEGFLEAARENLLTAVCPGPERVGLAWADLSTGRFELCEVPPEELAEEVLRHAPAELLLPETWRGGLDSVSGLEGRITYRPDRVFEPDSAQRILREHFRTASLEGFGVADLPAALGAAAAALDYLQETQKAPLSHFASLSRFDRERFLQIDPAAQRGLELLANSQTGSKEGSLLGVLDRCRTGMGSRLLRWWLLHPLRDRPEIEGRLDAVEALAADHRLRRDWSSSASGLPDFERLAARVATGRATPRELGALRQGCRALPELCRAAAGSPKLAQAREGFDPLADLLGILDRSLADDPPHLITEGGIFREGFDAELDGLRAVLREGKGWIARFQAEEAKRAGIGSLKVGYNRVFGYYIEVTNTHSEKIPADYVRKQTLKGAERYITPALKEQEGKVLSAQDRSRAWEHERFVRLREELAPFVARVQAAGRAIARLDALCSFASVAVERRYARPRFSDEPVLKAKGLRHPVIEARPEVSFVPNDLEIDGKTRLAVITGPNMAGKSTYIRQAALLAVMAQVGSFVPAAGAELGIVDRLFARIGAADDIARGQSTFMVEMSEAARILAGATRDSLVILDEIGRGTSTYDGVSLAWAIAERLARDVGARTLFATHYHELAALAGALPAVRNLNVLVREEAGEVVFLHRVAAGSTDRSYGIHVAQLAGVPPQVLARAREILADLEKSAGPHMSGDRRQETGDRERPVRDPIRQVLAEVNVEKLTPLQALNLLAELKQAAQKDGQAKPASGASARPKKRGAASGSQEPSLF